MGSVLTSHSGVVSGTSINGSSGDVGCTILLHSVHGGRFLRELKLRLHDSDVLVGVPSALALASDGHMIFAFSVMTRATMDSTSSSAAPAGATDPHRMMAAGASSPPYSPAAPVSIVPVSTARVKHVLQVCNVNGRYWRSAVVPSIITCLVVSPSAEFVVTGDDGGDITVRRLSDLQIVRQFQCTQSAITSLALSADEHYVLAGTARGMLHIYILELF